MKIDINRSLKRFNAWWDVFILEAIKPVAILSMGLGTVAIFNLQGLAINPMFVASWAIVQALSIDGLFFATWDRLFSTSPKKANVLPIIGLAIIGLTLALIAVAINAVLGFQVLWAIGSSENAMARLGISPELFTAIRAVLAVVVFVMISYVRARARANELSDVAQIEVAISPKKATRQRASSSPVVTEISPEPLAIPEVATSHLELAGATDSKKELVEVAIKKANEQGHKLNLKAISLETGASYSYVKLVNKEMGKVA
jgi:hypothetical protein